MSTPVERPAERLTIIVGESDRYHQKALHSEILHRAHAAGLAGASVWRGFEGYGARNHIHTTRILSLSEDLPVKVEIVDTPERIDEFVASLADLEINGLVVREPVTVLHRDGPGTDL
ncbi:MAG: DUF190 domain-containing protein [Actinomycetota bacterium]|nr:DUF190 domain-containing protein [Actinomycetota bacterium]MDA8292894.1 DUF190 domain-containing protein [Actinomycetota bacterium]